MKRQLVVDSKSSGTVEPGRVEEPAADGAERDVHARGRPNVGEVLVDQAEAPPRRDARQEIAGVEAELDPGGIEMGEHVAARHLEALLEEVGD